MTIFLSTEISGYLTSIFHKKTKKTNFINQENKETQEFNQILKQFIIKQIKDILQIFFCEPRNIF